MIAFSGDCKEVLFRLMLRPKFWSRDRQFKARVECGSGLGIEPVQKTSDCARKSLHGVEKKKACTPLTQ